MEPSYDQYSNSRYYDLYVYTNRSMCYCDNNGHHDRNAGNTDVQTKQTSLSEQYSTSIANDIKQWIYRNMESSYDQYSNSRSDYIYIYTNRSMCYDGNNGCHDW